MSFRLKDLGPGLLYAGAAIGVSHLVQSTRAGVLFGLDLLLVVLLVNLIKYPFFAVGATYPALTGQNLLWGYKKVGAWALHLFSISHLLSVFVVQAAVTVVTVGVLQVSLLSEVDLKVLNFGFLVLFLLMGRLGKFSFIDHLMKGIVFVLALLTVVAVFMSLTLNPHFSLGVFSITNKEHFLFLIALVGWMPGPMDIPVWQSLWCLSKRKENKNFDHKKALFDFRLGHGVTTLLALLFIILGAGLSTGSVEIPGSAAQFARFLVDLYVKNLGEGFRPVIAILAFLAMLSTSLTCFDAFTRLNLAVVQSYKSDLDGESSKNKFLSSVVLIVGTQLIVFFALSNMRALVDFATMLSFSIAPLLAYLNTRLMLSDDIPLKYRLSKKQLYFNMLGITLFALLTLSFLLTLTSF